MKASRTFPGSGLAMPSAARAVQRILGLAPPLEHERAAVIIRDAILAIGVLGIALFTRFWMLGGTGFSGDEAVYSGQAAVIAGDSEMARYFVLISRGNSNFLMFQYLVAGAYHLFGITDAVPRMVSAVFSTLTVPIAYELGRTLFNRRVAIGSAILLAASSYTIALGRLALLDAALGFFFALSMLFAAKWIRSQHSQNLWLYAFAAAAALAIQVKVTGVLVVVIAALYLVASGQIRKIRLRQWVGGGAVFVLFMAPALIEFAIDPHQFLALLGDSTRRLSNVPSGYYFRKLSSYEGFIFPTLWVLAVLIAVRWRTQGDKLLMAWILVGTLFFQLYPLKAYNYLLPLIPAYSVITARVIVSIADRIVAIARYPRLARRVAPVAFGALLLSTVAPISNTLAAQQQPGLREAAMWLAEHTPKDAGVMTISQGSAQYAISFYSQRDAYPFGRFRLATVMPGGEILPPQLPSNGTPRDWVVYWPPRLIEGGVVSYLVYWIDQPDDPPDDPLIVTETQRQFRGLVEAYGGQLMYTVYSHHEPTVWIYRVGKLLPHPSLNVADRVASKTGLDIQVQGAGYSLGSAVTVYYHRTRLGVFQADAQGRFTAQVRLPAPVRSSYQLLAIDSAGNRAIVTGLKAT